MTLLANSMTHGRKHSETDPKVHGERSGHFDTHVWASIVCSMISVGYVTSVIALYLHFPAVYALLLPEDGWVENATFAGFIVAAIWLGRLALQPGEGKQRVVWAVFAAAATFVALEEISWGQRIFNFSTPEPLRRINVQGQITLHNIEGVNTRALHIWASWGLLAWAVISLAATQIRGRFNADSLANWLPFCPPWLLPCCLGVVAMVLVSSSLKLGEFSELAIALLTLIWAADLYTHFSTRPAQGHERLFRYRSTAFVVAAAITVIFTLVLHQSSGWMLNFFAANQFPEAGMMEQSREVFEHILANPQYVTDETLANYQRLFPGDSGQ